MDGGRPNVSIEATRSHQPEDSEHGRGTNASATVAEHDIPPQTLPNTTISSADTLYSPSGTLNEKHSKSPTNTSSPSWLKLPEWPILRKTHGDGRPWRMTLIRLGPLSGIFSMLLAVASIVASLGILVGSKGEDVRSWKAPPPRFLAILTTVANLCVRSACLQGLSFLLVSG